MATMHATIGTQNHAVVSLQEWLTKRKELLQKEKDLTHLHDELARLRRELPWEKVEKSYVFEGPAGKMSLADLFDGRSQLVIYHFMFGPGWEAGCPSCSFVSDHFDATLIHLANRDVTLAVVSRAPFAQIEPFQRRMGWRFRWVSSNASDFNRDYHVSFTKEETAAKRMYYNYEVKEFPSEEGPGISVFFKDENGGIFHTYSAYARGGEPVMATYSILDMVPKGRNEDGLDFSMAWVRHHDRYSDRYFGQPKTAESTVKSPASCCGGSH